MSESSLMPDMSRCDPKTYADADYLQAYNYFSVQHHPEPKNRKPSVCEQYGHFYSGIPFEDKTKELIACARYGLSRKEIETPEFKRVAGQKHFLKGVEPMIAHDKLG